MDEPENTPQSKKTIRLTRSEAYAMGLSRPKKPGWKFGLAGLLLALVLGSVLWLFQEAWLPFWLEAIGQPDAGETMDATPAAAEAPADLPAPPPPPPPPPPAETPGTDRPLDFLSAAPWDHPSFQQGVRRFNQSLEQFRQARRNHGPAPLFQQAEEGTAQARQLFESLRAEAPPAVPLNDYSAQCLRLASEIRAARPSAAPPVSAASTPPPKPAGLTSQELKRHPLYTEGARLFNQTLEQFKAYQAQPSRKELLPSTEESARLAAGKFEELKRQIPETLHPEIDRLIHQCYGIVSACRGEQLKNGSEASASPAGRGTTGPSRRPALPAYRPTD